MLLFEFQILQTGADCGLEQAFSYAWQWMIMKINFAASIIGVLAAIAILLLSPQLLMCAGANTFYSIHIASYKSSDAADEFIFQLKNKGLDAFQKYEAIPGKGNWYRVYIGEYADSASAKKMMLSFKADGISDYYSVTEMLEDHQKDKKPLEAESLPQTTVNTMPSESRQINKDAAFGAGEQAAALQAPLGSDSSGQTSMEKHNNAAGDYVFYSVHIASFRSSDAADAFVYNLRAKGLDAFQKRQTAPDRGNWYMVFVGEYADSVSAKEMMHTLKADGMWGYYSVTKMFAQNPKGKNITPPPLVAMSQPQAAANSSPAEIQEVRKEDPNVEVSSPAHDGGFEKKQKAVDGTKKVSVGIRVGGYTAPDIEDFKVKKAGSTKTETWKFAGSNAYIFSLPASYRFNEHFCLEGRPELVTADGLDVFFISLGPKLDYELPHGIQPHISLGAVYGSFDWDYAPGDFDTAFGMESGIGISLVRPKFKIDADFLYRDIRFGYNPPTDDTIVFNQSQADFSGYSYSASMAYSF
ncbi:SPOR domain-containing protein [Desulfatibacillum aliphaticivorans]|uniref:SPOR domain-containing protein n=1 Tax=Desulfatibacillum aliphaticivorans TaxID=218208 RepID=UPI00048372D9|nr:SPOR domain-containing protein [Desulfatibacillum aliphaticivorans]